MDTLEEEFLKNKLLALKSTSSERIKLCYDNMKNVRYLYLVDLSTFSSNHKFRSFSRVFCSKLNPKLNDFYTDLELYTMPLPEVWSKSKELSQKKRKTKVKK